jgi:hypothetical protein
MDVAPCTRDIAAATWRQGYAWDVIEAVLDGSYDRYGPEPQEGVPPPPVANRHGDTPAKAAKRAELEVRMRFSDLSRFSSCRIHSWS